MKAPLHVSWPPGTPVCCLTASHPSLPLALLALSAPGQASDLVARRDARVDPPASEAGDWVEAHSLVHEAKEGVADRTALE